MKIVELNQEKMIKIDGGKRRKKVKRSKRKYLKNYNKNDWQASYFGTGKCAPRAAGVWYSMGRNALFGAFGGVGGVITGAVTGYFGYFLEKKACSKKWI